MSKKIIISLLATFVLFLAMPARAEEFVSQFPELNPYCWRRIDCHNARKNFLVNTPSCAVGDSSCKELEQGFVTGASVDPCKGGGAVGSPEEFGRCLPAGTTKTEISFGGQDRFSNIGEFIVVMYKYLLTIASIVAVVVIIIAGMQWVTSGGNSEAISSAKKRIGGAVIGLFIAYMSYFVLNTINPALVNLRLPQVWLVRPKAVVNNALCQDINGAKEGNLRFAFYSYANQPNEVLPLSVRQDFRVTSTNDLLCGTKFLVETGGDSTCFGSAGCGFDEKGHPLACWRNKLADNYKCMGGSPADNSTWDNISGFYWEVETNLLKLITPGI